MTTKERILETSITLFAQKGYTETTLKEIAHGCGIRSASIYNHFASKSNILDHILQDYAQYTKSNTLTKEEIASRAKTDDPQQLMMSMFYRYDRKNAEKYSRILKIILHEHLRNEEIGDFFTKHFIYENEIRLDFLLSQLMENGRIRPINHRYCAKILNSITLSMSLEFNHRGKAGEYSSPERISMDELLSFAIDVILNGGTPEPKAQQYAARWIKQGMEEPEGID